MLTCEACTVEPRCLSHRLCISSLMCMKAPCSHPLIHCRKASCTNRTGRWCLEIYLPVSLLVTSKKGFFASNTFSVCVQFNVLQMVNPLSLVTEEQICLFPPSSLGLSQGPFLGDTATSHILFASCLILRPQSRCRGQGSTRNPTYLVSPILTMTPLFS